MKTIHVFENSLDRSDDISLEVVLSCNDKGLIKGEIFDARNDPEYQKIDIDFFSIHNDKKTTIEVKVDFQDKTGNLFLETNSYYHGKDSEKNTLGCFLKTKADIMIYHFVYSNMTYFMNRKCLDYIIKPEFYSMYREGDVINMRNGREVLTKGRLIPRQWFKENQDKGIKIFTDIMDDNWVESNKELLQLNSEYWKNREKVFRQYYRTNEFM